MMKNRRSETGDRRSKCMDATGAWHECRCPERDRRQDHETRKWWDARQKEELTVRVGQQPRRAHCPGHSRTVSDTPCDYCLEQGRQDGIRIGLKRHGGEK